MKNFAWAKIQTHNLPTWCHLVLKCLPHLEPPLHSLLLWHLQVTSTQGDLAALTSKLFWVDFDLSKDHQVRLGLSWLTSLAFHYQILAATWTSWTSNKGADMIRWLVLSACHRGTVCSPQILATVWTRISLIFKSDKSPMKNSRLRPGT